MSDYGLKTWFEGENAEVDIVFVHGLLGNWENTWSSKGVVWPKEFLSQDIPNSRLFSFGYDSGIWHADPSKVTQGNLDHEAKTLCSLLHGRREETRTSDRPVITVAHSLGGLVCAQIIVSGDTAGEGHSVQAISNCMKGMIFLGTPFGGSKSARLGDFCRKLTNAVSKDTDKMTLKNLKPDSQQLRDLRSSFPGIIKNRLSSSMQVSVVFFFEKHTTNGVLVVAEKDASYPGIGEIEPMLTNHSEICKFSSKEDHGYLLIKSKVQLLMQGYARVQEDSSSPTYKIINDGKIVNQINGGTNHIDRQSITM